MYIHECGYMYDSSIMFATGTDDLFDVKTEVDSIAAEWYNFGMALNLEHQQLSVIKIAEHRPKECLNNVLVEFLKKNYDWEKYGVPSWRLIVIALGHRTGGNNTELALRVAEEHYSDGM